MEVAGHEQFHIEMFDQHLHQRWGFDQAGRMDIYYDGVGSGGGRKTVQWWTDVVWGGSAYWLAYDYGSWGYGQAKGHYTSGPFYANIDEWCYVYDSGWWDGYWYVKWRKLPLWHLHTREYAGYPPDW